jgi:hypothetical protein
MREGTGGVSRDIFSLGVSVLRSYKESRTESNCRSVAYKGESISHGLIGVVLVAYQFMFVLHVKQYQHPCPHEGLERRSPARANLYISPAFSHYRCK